MNNTIIQNMYWSELSEEGQNSLIKAGYKLTEDVKRGNSPVGSIRTEVIEETSEIKLIISPINLAGASTNLY